MEDKVVVLTDEKGQLYLIGRDILELARVRSEEHAKVVKELVQDAKAGKAAPLRIVGGYPVSKDRFLKTIRLTPNYVTFDTGANPA